MVRLKRWAEEKIPALVRDEIRLEVGVRGKYYWDAEPSNSVAPLLEEIDNDPTGIFWG